MSNKRPRKLAIRRETLRVLGATDLDAAAGGLSFRNNCTVRLSGCISIVYTYDCPGEDDTQGGRPK